jgi:hypothetical protein
MSFIKTVDVFAVSLDNTFTAELQCGSKRSLSTVHGSLNNDNAHYHDYTL